MQCRWSISKRQETLQNISRWPCFWIELVLKARRNLLKYRFEHSVAILKHTIGKHCSFITFRSKLSRYERKKERVLHFHSSISNCLMGSYPFRFLHQIYFLGDTVWYCLAWSNFSWSYVQHRILSQKSTQIICLCILCT